MRRVAITESPRFASVGRLRRTSRPPAAVRRPPGLRPRFPIGPLPPRRSPKGPAMHQPTFSRRRFSQLLAAGAASAAFAGVLSSCAKSDDATSAAPADGSQPKNQVIVSMPTSAEPEAGFDPFVSWGCGEHVHEPLIQSTLIRTDADMGLHNDLATSYECSEDGMVWTFKIRRRRGLHHQRDQGRSFVGGRSFHGVRSRRPR